MRTIVSLLIATTFVYRAGKKKKLTTSFPMIFDSEIANNYLKSVQ